VIDPGIDLEYWRAELARRTRVQIPGWLQPEVAEALHRCLAHAVPWGLAHRTAEGPATTRAEALAALDEAAREALLAEARALAGREYAFAYDAYHMVTAYKEGRDPDLLLHRLLEFMNSPEYLGFARALTGEPRIRRASAQATRYRAGQFLKFHTDIDSREGRLYAYVVNLSRRWEADWGGLLQFIDDGGAVVDTFVPRFNSLSLFKVPQGHAVSLVAPWAGEPRLAVTGWFMA
jgi:Rps23 Pro-64 3,4-dihydroxylase Tpa1-like proline 4-hydroxylase